MCATHKQISQHFVALNKQNNADEKKYSLA